MFASRAMAVFALLVLAAVPVAAGAEEAPAEQVPAPSAEESIPGLVLPASVEDPAPRLRGYRSPSRRFGLRMGYTDFASSEGEIDRGLLLGLFQDGSAGGRLAYEIGLDFASAEATDGSFASSLLFGRFDVLLPAGSAGPRAGGYILCGAAGAAEITDDVTGRYTNFVGIVNLGTGFGIADGRFDLRFTYSMPFGSGNATGLALVSAGMRF